MTTLFSSGKKLSAAFILLAAFIGLTSAKPIANTNFSGQWKLNESKSEFGQFGSRMATRKITIVQSVDSMALDITSPSMQGEEMQRKETVMFNGQEHETEITPNVKKRSKASWTDNGQSLTINSVITIDNNGNTMDVNVTEVWTLADGGKTLMMQSKSSSSFGETAMKLQYDKVQ